MDMVLGVESLQKKKLLERKRAKGAKANTSTKIGSTRRRQSRARRGEIMKTSMLVLARGNPST
jgi:hypothetical protein